MNSKCECQCHEDPCVCGSDICLNRTSSESTKIQTIDEHGNIHNVESIYKKIPLTDFENVAKSYEAQQQQSEGSAIDAASNPESIGDSNLNPTIKEEKEDPIDCNDCCEHIYATPSPAEKFECKQPCNITAELYCQIKRQYAEPDEKISVCSTSSSESDSESESDEDYEENTIYESAQCKTEDIEGNSEEVFSNDDEDTFDPSSAFHSTLIDDNRIRCQDENCCSLDPNNKCKHNKLQSNAPGDQNTTTKEKEKKLVKNITNVGDSNDITDTKWTTIEPTTSRLSQGRQQRYSENEVKKKLSINENKQKSSINENKQKLSVNDDTVEPRLKSRKQQKQLRIQHPEDDTLLSEGTISVKQTDSITNIPEVSFKSNEDETSIRPEAVIENERETDSQYSLKKKRKSYETNWRTDVMASKTASDMRVKSSDIMWSVINTENNENFDDLTNKNKNIGEKHVTLPGRSRNDISSEIQYIANNRKRKYGSEPNVFPELKSAASVDYRYTTAKSFSGRRKRMTVSDFVPEEQLQIIDVVVPDIPKPPLKPEHTDAYFLLQSPSETEYKRLWNTTVPCERSNLAIMPVDSFIKKTKNKAPPLEDKSKKPVQMSIGRGRESFFRQQAVPFKPRKLLCFKYIPNISPKTSLTSAEQNLSISQLYIDPPERISKVCVIPLARSQGSRIPTPVSTSDQKDTFQIDKRKLSDPFDGTSERRLTVGKDDIRNVLVQKSNVVRRSLIPPELRKSLYRSKSTSRKSLTFNTDDDIQIFTSRMSISRKKRPSKSVTSETSDDGSDTSLRNKMKQFYPQDENQMTRISVEPPLISVLKQEKKQKKKFKQEGHRKKFEKNKNILQKTCCSQTGIHVCIKESTTKNGNEESNIVQMVNIDVTPKNSELVKVNVLPTVPEINKEGIITIPVQLQLYNELSQEEKQKNKKCAENSCKHCTEKIIREEREENITECDNIETQTDLTLGQKILSKSLNSLKSNDSSSTVENKSDPVHRTCIDWNNIVLPPPGSITIKKSPIKKRRYSDDHNKPKDNNEAATSEEIKPKTEESEPRDQKSKFIYCCPMGKSQDEPYKPANDYCAENDTTRRDCSSADEPKCKHSKIISLVFSESFYEKENYTNPLDQSQVENERAVSPCTSKPEIPWSNILLPDKPQIKKIEKLDTSKTSTSITDQMENSTTDEYNFMSPSPKTTDTCPNLSEDSSHTCECNKSFDDKGTNTTPEDEVVEEEEADAVSYSTKPYKSNKMSTNSMDILKAFKEDPVLSAFKAFEEELKPVRKALAEVQSKLRALNIPELECIFKKDPISEYALSRSNSQIEGILGRSSDDNRYPSSCFRQMPSERFDYNQGPSKEFKVHGFNTPPFPVRSRHLSTDIWKTFGSCDRNTIQGHYEKFWQPPYNPNMRNTDSYSCPHSSSRNYNSRHSTPESDIKYVSFDPSGIIRCKKNYSGPYFPNIYDKRVEMINDNDDLDYPPTYRNTPTTSHACCQQNCYCDSEHSSHSSETERLPSNHILTNAPPKFSSSIHVIAGECCNRFIPVKVTPVSPYFMGDEDAGIGLRNCTHSSTRNTSINMKNGIVYARTKIELPHVAYKHGNNMAKNVRKVYSQTSDSRNHYSHSEHDAFRYNEPPNDCTCEYPTVDNNLPNFPSYYNEYLPKERYT